MQPGLVSRKAEGGRRNAEGGTRKAEGGTRKAERFRRAQGRRRTIGRPRLSDRIKQSRRPKSPGNWTASLRAPTKWPSTHFILPHFAFRLPPCVLTRWLCFGRFTIRFILPPFAFTLQEALGTQCWDSEQSAEIDVALSVHPRHAVEGCPGRARVMSDLIILQRIAERAIPPGRRAEGPEKWQKMAVLECISSICTPV